MNKILSKIIETINSLIKRVLKKPMFLELLVGTFFSLLIIFISVSGSEREKYMDEFTSIDIDTQEQDDPEISDDNVWGYDWDDLERGEELSVIQNSITESSSSNNNNRPKVTATPKPTATPVITSTPTPEIIIEETPLITIEPEVPETSEEPEVILDPTGPVIVTDFEGDHVTDAFAESITITGYYPNGNKIPEDDIFVLHNQELIYPELISNQAVSYYIEYVEGENTIQIITLDDESEDRLFEYKVTYIKSEVPSAIISVDANSIGLGYMIAPTYVTLEEGKPIAYYVKQLLKNNGYTTFASGSQNNNYQFKGLYRSDLFKSISPVISDELLYELFLYDPNLKINPTNYYNNFIKNDYFTDGSKWIIELNGELYFDSMSNYFLQDGDVLKLRYTLLDGIDLYWLKHKYNPTLSGETTDTDIPIQDDNPNDEISIQE